MMSFRKLLGVMLFTLAFGIGMASLLSYYKFKGSLSETVRARMTLVAGDVEDAISQSLKLGLQISVMDALPNLVKREKSSDPLITSVDIADASGKILFSSSKSLVNTMMPPSWLKAGIAANNNVWRTTNQSNNDLVVGKTLRNSFNLPIGFLSIQYSSQQLDQQAAAVKVNLLLTSIIILALASFACGLIFVLVRRSNSEAAKKNWLIITPIMVTLAISLLVMSGRLVPIFEESLLPELNNKAVTVARIEAALISKAASYGVTPEKLIGVTESFKNDLHDSPEFNFMELRNKKDEVLVHLGQPNNTVKQFITQPIEYDGDVLGSVRIGLDPAFAEKLAREVTMDLLVVLIVALVFTVEVLSFSIAGKGSPTQQASPYIAARAPVFVFFLSEELLRSFLPSFVAQMPHVDIGLSWQVVAGLPLIAFMLVVALGQPILGSISDKFGVRRVLAIGAVVAAIGLLGAALSNSVYVLLLSRIVGAIGYGAAFVASQGFILNHTTIENRTKGFALFVGGFMAASICGSSLGGILADNIGMRATIITAASLAFISLIFILRLPADEPTTLIADDGDKQVGGRFFKILGNFRFAALCLFAGIPAKLLLSGICFYLLPLYVLSVGSNQAMTGRILMVYAVLIVLIMPFAARAADKRSLHKAFVFSGLIVSAVGGLTVLLIGDLWVALALSISIGLGQAFSIASQSTLVGRVAETQVAQYGQGAVYGVYRLVERLGTALGPLVAAILLTVLGYEKTFIAFSAFAIFCALMFAIIVGRASGSANLAPTTTESI